MRFKKKISINAIQDSDLVEALKLTTQYQELIEGKVLCVSCGDIITEENIGVIQPIRIEDKLIMSFFCEKMDCVEEFKRNSNE